MVAYNMADMRADFADWLNQEVKLEHSLSVNEYGEHSYDLQVMVMGRIEHKRRAILTKDNETLISLVTIYVPSEPVVNADDRLTLPDGTTPVILAVDKQPDEYGQIYYQAIMT